MNDVVAVFLACAVLAAAVTYVVGRQCARELDCDIARRTDAVKTDAVIAEAERILREA